MSSIRDPVPSESYSFDDSSKTLEISVPDNDNVETLALQIILAVKTAGTSPKAGETMLISEPEAIHIRVKNERGDNAIELRYKSLENIDSLKNDILLAKESAPKRVYSSYKSEPLAPLKVKHSPEGVTIFIDTRHDHSLQAYARLIIDTYLKINKDYCFSVAPPPLTLRSPTSNIILENIPFPRIDEDHKTIADLVKALKRNIQAKWVEKSELENKTTAAKSTEKNELENKATAAKSTVASESSICQFIGTQGDRTIYMFSLTLSNPGEITSDHHLDSIMKTLLARSKRNVPGVELEDLTITLKDNEGNLILQSIKFPNPFTKRRLRINIEERLEQISEENAGVQQARIDREREKKEKEGKLEKGTANSEKDTKTRKSILKTGNAPPKNVEFSYTSMTKFFEELEEDRNDNRALNDDVISTVTDKSANTEILSTNSSRLLKSLETIPFIYIDKTYDSFIHAYMELGKSCNTNEDKIELILDLITATINVNKEFRKQISELLKTKKNLTVSFELSDNELAKELGLEPKGNLVGQALMELREGIRERIIQKQFEKTPVNIDNVEYQSVLIAYMSIFKAGIEENPPLYKTWDEKLALLEQIVNIAKVQSSDFKNDLESFLKYINRDRLLEFNIKESPTQTGTEDNLFGEFLMGLRDKYVESENEAEEYPSKQYNIAFIQQYLNEQISFNGEKYEGIIIAIEHIFRDDFSQIKQERLEEILFEFAKQNKKLKELLLETGNSFLIANYDKEKDPELALILGQGKKYGYTGENLMGKALTAVRNKLRAKSESDVKREHDRGAKPESDATRRFDKGDRKS